MSSIRCRKWCWLVHTLRQNSSNLARSYTTTMKEGSRRAQEQLERMGYFWERAKALANNSVGWRVLVGHDALYSLWGVKEWWWILIVTVREVWGGIIKLKTHYNLLNDWFLSLLYTWHGWRRLRSLKELAHHNELSQASSPECLIWSVLQVQAHC